MRSAELLDSKVSPETSKALHPIHPDGKPATIELIGTLAYSDNCLTPVVPDKTLDPASADNIDASLEIFSSTIIWKGAISCSKTLVYSLVFGVLCSLISSVTIGLVAKNVGTTIAEHNQTPGMANTLSPTTWINQAGDSDDTLEVLSFSILHGIFYGAFACLAPGLCSLMWNCSFRRHVALSVVSVCSSILLCVAVISIDLLAGFGFQTESNIVYPLSSVVWATFSIIFWAASMTDPGMKCCIKASVIGAIVLIGGGSVIALTFSISIFFRQGFLTKLLIRSLIVPIFRGMMIMVYAVALVHVGQTREFARCTPLIMLYSVSAASLDWMHLTSGSLLFAGLLEFANLFQVFFEFVLLVRGRSYFDSCIKCLHKRTSRVLPDNAFSERDKLAEAKDMLGSVTAFLVPCQISCLVSTTVTFLILPMNPTSVSPIGQTSAETISLASITLVKEILLLFAQCTFSHFTASRPKGNMAVMKEPWQLISQSSWLELGIMTLCCILGESWVHSQVLQSLCPRFVGNLSTEVVFCMCS